MDFGTLTVIVLAGLAGPLLGVAGRRFVPVMIGEIAAGIVVGPALIGAVDPADATTTFLSDVGFAMLMLTVGMHLPLRDPRLAASLRDGGRLAALVCLLAVPAGLAAAAIAGTGHAAVYAVLLASGSAAVLLPALQEARTESRAAMTAMAQVTVADVITILAVPIVLIAGFAAGVMVALLGGPHRLSVQTRGVADGFFVPLYFVALGAGLDVSGLAASPELLALVATLTLLNVAIRLLATALLRQPAAVAYAASAQLGVPAAVASLGLAEQVISPSVATAIVASALLSLAVGTLGVERLARG